MENINLFMHICMVCSISSVARLQVSLREVDLISWLPPSIFADSVMFRILQNLNPKPPKLSSHS